MKKGVFKRHEISYEKHLEIVVYKNNDKSCCEIATIVGCSSFRCVQKVLQIKNCKNLLRVARQEKFTRVSDGHVTLPVLEPLMPVHNYALSAVN